MKKTIPKISHGQCRRFNTHVGFTLLEVMISLAIISIVLVSIYRMHAQTISMNYDARFYATASLLAQMKIAALTHKAGKELADDSGDFGDEHPGYSWKVEIQDVESEPLGDASENLKKIDVTVLLGNERLSYSLRTYKWMDN